MDKSIKGALAAGGAAVLLLGGAGTLAFWTDSATVNGGAINSGNLTLDPAGPCTDIVYANGFAGSPNPVGNWVPGDVVSTTCTFTIGAEGDNLAATPTIPNEVEVTGPASAVSLVGTADATYSLNGTTYDGSTPITEANDGDALVATITVTFPYGTDETGSPIVNGNDTQNIDATLQDLTVTLTQDDPQAAPAAPAPDPLGDLLP